MKMKKYYLILSILLAIIALITVILFSYFSHPIVKLKNLPPHEKAAFYFNASNSDDGVWWIKGFVNCNSKEGLIHVLEDYEGYTKQQAQQAVQKMELNEKINWKDQAYRVAKGYLKNPISKKSLMECLEIGYKFTKEETISAIEKLERKKEVNWNEQAYKKAKEELLRPISKLTLKINLENSGFTKQQIEQVLKKL